MILTKPTLEETSKAFAAVMVPYPLF